MSRPSYLLDTNILTGILKKDARVVAPLTAALADNARLILSPIVYYEIKRGLLKRDAKRQLNFFEQWVKTLWWEDVLRADWTMAAELWATETAQGRPPQDADILIAAQSRRLKATLVTANIAHFKFLGIWLENWLD
jgi:tRNA(fMet)-specific endonuclease VapC